MSFICVGCQQVQESKDKFAPVINHTHTIAEQKPVESVFESILGPVFEMPIVGQISANVSAKAETSAEKLRREVTDKMRADGATDEQISAVVELLA